MGNIDPRASSTGVPIRVFLSPQIRRSNFFFSKYFRMGLKTYGSCPPDRIVGEAHCMIGLKGRMEWEKGGGTVGHDQDF